MLNKFGSCREISFLIFERNVGFVGFTNINSSEGGAGASGHCGAQQNFNHIKVSPGDTLDISIGQGGGVQENGGDTVVYLEDRVFIARGGNPGEHGESAERTDSAQRGSVDVPQKSDFPVPTLGGQGGTTKKQKHYQRVPSTVGQGGVSSGLNGCPLQIMKRSTATFLDHKVEHSSERDGATHRFRHLTHREYPNQVLSDGREIQGLDMNVAEFISSGAYFQIDAYRHPISVDVARGGRTSSNGTGFGLGGQGQDARPIQTREYIDILNTNTTTWTFRKIVESDLSQVSGQSADIGTDGVVILMYYTSKP